MDHNWFILAISFLFLLFSQGFSSCVDHRYGNPGKSCKKIKDPKFQIRGVNVVPMWEFMLLNPPARNRTKRQANYGDRGFQQRAGFVALNTKPVPFVQQYQHRHINRQFENSYRPPIRQQISYENNRNIVSNDMRKNKREEYFPAPSKVSSEHQTVNNQQQQQAPSFVLPPMILPLAQQPLYQENPPPSVPQASQQQPYQQQQIYQKEPPPPPPPPPPSPPHNYQEQPTYQKDPPPSPPPPPSPQNYQQLSTYQKDPQAYQQQPTYQKEPPPQQNYQQQSQYQKQAPLQKSYLQQAPSSDPVPQTYQHQEPPPEQVFPQQIPPAETYFQQYPQIQTPYPKSIQYQQQPPPPYPTLSTPVTTEYSEIAEEDATTDEYESSEKKKKNKKKKKKNKKNCKKCDDSSSEEDTYACYLCRKKESEEESEEKDESKELSITKYLARPKVPERYPLYRGKPVSNMTEAKEPKEETPSKFSGNIRTAGEPNTKYSDAPNVKYSYPPKDSLPLKTCFHNPSGYVCCDLDLNNLVESSYKEVREEPDFNPCNLQKIANNVQRNTEEMFNHPFEIVVSHGDFAQNVNFAGNLVCKLEIDGKYMIAYGTPYNAEKAVGPEGPDGSPLPVRSVVL